jgi:Protein of unknown function (DUF983)
VAVEIKYAPAMWLQLAGWVPFTIGLSLGLLQPLKGAIVAIQWLGGMHGFARARNRRGDLGTRLEMDTGIKPGDEVTINPLVDLVDASKVQPRRETVHQAG